MYSEGNYPLGMLKTVEGRVSAASATKPLQGTTPGSKKEMSDSYIPASQLYSFVMQSNASAASKFFAQVVATRDEQKLPWFSYLSCLCKEAKPSCECATKLTDYRTIVSAGLS